MGRRDPNIERLQPRIDNWEVVDRCGGLEGVRARPSLGLDVTNVHPPVIPISGQFHTINESLLSRIEELVSP